MNDWKPIETLPAKRVGDLIELKRADGTTTEGWMNTNLRCAPRVFFTWDNGVPKYVAPTHWREMPSRYFPETADYIPCVY